MPTKYYQGKYGNDMYRTVPLGTGTYSTSLLGTVPMPVQR